MMKFDVIIIGSGPAGCTAAIYAQRAGLETAMITGDMVGGQLMTTTDVENYPGYSSVIQGPWLVEQMRSQAEGVGVQIIYDHIKIVAKSDMSFELIGESGTNYSSVALIVATGAEAKWLGTDDEKKFRGYGVSGCATCDGFFFKNKDVMVIGGGNTAVEEALFLTNHANRVYLVHRRDSLKAEKIMQDRLFLNKKIELIWNNILEGIVGNESPLSVTGAILKSVVDGKLSEVSVNGIFIAIGHAPNTSLFKGILDMDEYGYIITEPGTTKTNVPGIYAAGDVQDRVYRQAVTAAGSGCMAALDASKYIDGLNS